MITVYAIRLLVGWVGGLIDPIVAGTRLAQYTANIEVVGQ